MVGAIYPTLRVRDRDVAATGGMNTKLREDDQ
jgi:hypothetical protein